MARHWDITQTGNNRRTASRGSRRRGIGTSQKLAIIAARQVEDHNGETLEHHSHEGARDAEPKPRFFEARARERAKEVEAILHVQDQIEIEEGDKFLIYNFYAQCSRRRAKS